MDIAQFLANLTFKRSLGIGLLIAGFYYLIFFDSGTSIIQAKSAVDQQIQSLEAEQMRIERSIEAYQQNLATKKQLGNEMDRIMSYIPKDLTTTEIIKYINTEAKAAGANIVSVEDKNTRPGQPQRGQGQDSSDDPFEPLVVQVELEGNFAQMMLFLSYLTKIDKIITISDLKVTRIAKDQRGGSQIRFEALFTGYKYKEFRPRSGGSS